MGSMTLIGIEGGGGAATPFPDFDKILDFTSDGSDSSVSVSVDGDTDKEYKVLIRSTDADHVWIRLNSDTGTNYGFEYLDNTSGSLAAANTALSSWYVTLADGIGQVTLLTPTGLTKTGFQNLGQRSTGTTVIEYRSSGFSYNSTSNITAINFLMSSGNFASGTRIIVYARKVN